MTAPSDLEHWKDQIVPMENEIVLEPIGQTFIDGNFEKIVQNINRKKERSKYQVRVLDDHLECRTVAQKTNIFQNSDSDPKTKKIWYNEIQSFSIQSSDESSQRVSIVRLNDELIFRTMAKPRFLSHVLTNLYPEHGIMGDSAEFVSFASVEFDEKANMSIPEALVVLRDRSIHIYSTKDELLEPIQVDIRYRL